MALVQVSKILRECKEEGKCAIAFSGFNLESIGWVIETAEEENTPVILLEYPTYSSMIEFSTFAAVTKELAGRVKIDVGLMIDHSPDMETAMKAVSGGFTSVMVDFSSLPFEENVRRTAEVVRYCHAMGIDVEGEVGHVGSGMNEADYLDEAGYTRPETAVEYVKRTGVDQLAVAIGTAHGNYKASPKLDLERLDKIREAIDIPLVLHGGSGVPYDQLREAFKRGICKLNIATDYNQYIYHCVKNLVLSDNADKKRMSDCIKEARPLAKEYIRNLIRMGNGKN